MSIKKNLLGVVLAAGVAAFSQIGTASAAWEIGGFSIPSMDEMLNAGKSKWKKITAKEKEQIQATKTEIYVVRAGEMKELMKMALPGFQKLYPNTTVKIYKKKIGSVAMMEMINEGNEQNFTVAIPASNGSAIVWEDYDSEEAESLALSPVVFLIKETKAKALEEALGRKLTFKDALELSGRTWAELVPGNEEAASWGLFQTHFTDPNKSNSGRLVQATAMFEGTGAYALTFDMVSNNDFRSWMSGVFKNTIHTKPSTDSLAKSYRGSDFMYTGGVIVYEYYAPGIVKASKKDAVRLVYPNRVLFSDFPAFIVDDSDSAKVAAAEAFIDYMRSVEVQQMAAELGFRPVNPEVPVASSLEAIYTRDLPFIPMIEDSGIFEAGAEAAQ